MSRRPESDRFIQHSARRQRGSYFDDAIAELWAKHQADGGLSPAVLRQMRHARIRLLTLHRPRLGSAELTAQAWNMTDIAVEALTTAAARQPTDERLIFARRTLVVARTAMDIVQARGQEDHSYPELPIVLDLLDARIALDQEEPGRAVRHTQHARRSLEQHTSSPGSSPSAWRALGRLARDTLDVQRPKNRTAPVARRLLNQAAAEYETAFPEE